jgi:hypothetical protein
MPVKIIYEYTRPSTDVAWKNPIRVKEWEFVNRFGSPPVGQLAIGEQEYSEDGLWQRGWQIYTDLESMIRTEAYHPRVKELRIDQEKYREEVGIKMTVRMIDTDTGNDIPFSMLENKREEMRAQGFDPLTAIK